MSQTPSLPSRPKTYRGVALLETLLALAIGGVVLVGSAAGLQKYTDGVKVTATSTMLDRFNTAAGLFADDNFADLVANAPQELPIAVLAPYLGSGVRTDPFKNSYVITTRTYTYTTPDPVTAGVLTKDALQLLIVGRNTNGIPSEIEDRPLLRTMVANSTGTGAGYIVTPTIGCRDAAGAALPAGSICGAFGAYNFAPTQFPATNLANANLVSLVTKGDSSVYGDQLYRYDYGDPELNTMHTDLNMDDNPIHNAANIDGTQRLAMEGPASLIDNAQGSIGLQPRDNLLVSPGSGLTIFSAPAGIPGRNPTLLGSGGRLQIGQADQDLVVGDDVSETVTGPYGSTTAMTATGDIMAKNAYLKELRADGVTSLHGRGDEPLKLQDLARGEAIVGQRVRYAPPSALMPDRHPVYELTDGTLTAGHLVAQDVSCADCGGSLSEILPRWRHMGTYLIAYTAPADPEAPTSGRLVPKPNCYTNRRDYKTQANVGDPARDAATTDDERYQDTNSDTRYIPRIIVLPKHVITGDPGEEGQAIGQPTKFDIDMIAKDHSPTEWRVVLNKSNWLGQDGIRAEGLAMTYCVFTGGEADKVDPANPTNVWYPTRAATPNSLWYRIPGSPN